MVNHDTWPGDIFQDDCNWLPTAEAENHRDMQRNVANEIAPNWNHASIGRRTVTTRIP